MRITPRLARLGSVGVFVFGMAALWMVSPQRVQAEDRERQAQLRAAVWEAMVKVLPKHGLIPEQRTPEQRHQSLANPPSRISTFRSENGDIKAFTVPIWEVEADRPPGASGYSGFGPKKPKTYKMTRTGSTRGGGPAMVGLSISLHLRAPQFRRSKAGPSRPRKAIYHLDFKPRAEIEVPPGKALLEMISRRVEGQRRMIKRTLSRSYVGLKGHVSVIEQQGLLPGRFVAWKNGGTPFYDSASERTELQRMTVEVVNPVAGGWMVLQVDANVPIHCDPALRMTEERVHALMEAFASAYMSVADPRAEVGKVRLLDANPIYTGGMPVKDMAGPEDVHTLVTTERKAVAADGVTQVLVEVELDEPGILRLEVAKADDSAFESGTIEMLFSGRALPVGKGKKKRIVGYGLYTPPRSFAEPRRRMKGGVYLPAERYRDLVATRKVLLAVSRGPSRKELTPSSLPIEIPLVRPPVILVHGTFDNPDECWEGHARDIEPTKGTVSMGEALRKAGNAVFKLDFSKTSGSAFGDAKRSSFAHNARVMWESPCGIYDTLRVYREEHAIAATQVDVVGHSLGGLIPRLWASEKYNPAGSVGGMPFDRRGTTGYRRLGNFEQGDVHRLITIATPHMGSDLGHLGIALQEAPAEALATISEQLHLASLVVGVGRKAVEKAVLFWIQKKKGYGIVPAVEDQRPHLKGWPNPAISKIGATRIPSHAVVCAATISDVSTFGGLYETVLKLTAWYMLNIRPETVMEFFVRRGQAEDLDRLYGEVIELDRHERDSDEGAGSWLFDRDHPVRVTDNYTLYALGRAILFGNTQNDMVVRVESQRGGLPFQYRTFVRGVLHSFATRYDAVQRGVVEALSGPEWRFAPDGFPAPQPMGSNERFEVTQDPADRAEFITLSNIVPSHAEALSYVAHTENVILIMRPVNQYATMLIAANMATKDMHVKGKSANWGPQRGFIPVDQRFSKLHFAEGGERTGKIKKFDGKVQECLRDNRAREKTLHVRVCGTDYDVLVVQGDNVEPPDAIVLKATDQDDYKGWESGGSMRYDPAKPLPTPRMSIEQIERRGTRPFMVLADRHTRIALTADYDILAFGPDFEPGKKIWDPEMGAVVEWQKALIGQMNNQIRLRTNYVGGNVSHHGPETQFSSSPGADYPNSVFEPDGDIWIIQEGPPGQEDLHLKRYFNVMRGLGWHLDPNPDTWNWGEHKPKVWPSTGWRPDDRLRLLPKTSQADNPFDSDEGDEPIPVAAATGGR